MENDTPRRMPNVPPFVKFVCANVPMVFDDSLSYYEALCALWKYVQGMTDVINNNATLEEEYIEKFNELKEFVDNYFDNLDVQEEINNKLDAMVEDGTLQEIIYSYLQANVAWTFDTVADMKASTNLIAGSYARTLGYYSTNDGGGSLYKIVNAADSSVHQEELDSGLYANLIIEGTADIRQYGVSTTLTDNTTALQEAIDRNTVLNGFNGTIRVSGNITIEHTRFYYDFKKLRMVCRSETTLEQFITIQGEDSNRVRGRLENLEIDSSGNANVSLAIYDARGLEISELDITGAIQKEIHVIGGKNASTANIRTYSVRCEVNRSLPNWTSCVGLVIDTSDNRINGFTSHGYMKHIENHGMNWFIECHSWNWYEVVNTVMLETTTQCKVDNFYSDTLETAIKITSAGNAEQVFVNNINFYMNPSAPDTSNCTPKPFVVNSSWVTSGGRLKVTNGQFAGVSGNTSNLVTTPDGTYSTSTHQYNFVNCYTGSTTSFRVQPIWFEYYRKSPTIDYTGYTAWASTPTTDTSVIVYEKGACHYFFRISGTLDTVQLGNYTELGKIDVPMGQPTGIPMNGTLMNNSKVYPIWWSITSVGTIRIFISSDVTLSGSSKIVLSGMTTQSSLPNE